MAGKCLSSCGASALHSRLPSHSSHLSLSSVSSSSSFSLSSSSSRFPFSSYSSFSRPSPACVFRFRIYPVLVRPHLLVRASCSRSFSSSSSSSPSSFSTFSARLAALLNEVRRFWDQKSLQQKVKYSSLLLNTAFIAFMSSRLFDHQRTTDTLFEEELKRKSSESDDWKCYHSHRLFYSQCRDFGALGGRSGVRTPEGDGRLAAAATESKQESEDGKEEAAGDLPGEIPVDFLCSRLEGELQKCRESLARYLPDETPAMKEITDITNLPPWLKDRPVYVQYFERKAKQRNREEAQANDEETDSSSCSCSL